MLKTCHCCSQLGSDHFIFRWGWKIFWRRKIYFASERIQIIFSRVTLGQIIYFKFSITTLVLAMVQVIFFISFTLWARIFFLQKFGARIFFPKIFQPPRK